ncbi:elongation factor 1-delta isoform 2-T2 [Gastrophryne carolinensis]
MRTRKHQSPVEPTMAAKHKCENGKRPACEAQAAAAKKGMEAANGFNQHDAAENPLSADQKKANSKKQRKRRKSPKTKALVAGQDASLVGLMAETVWLDKYTYDEAECAYHGKLAAQRAQALEKHQAAAVDQKEERKKRSSESCSHGNVAACHHMDNGVWINKFAFDDAESQFVERFASPLAPRTLNLDLVPHDRRPARAAQRTPDEGYSSATPTPATQDRLPINAAASDPTVNGKPHWAMGLLSEVWLDKTLYDQAERHFYEHVANAPSTTQTQPSFTWNLLPGKKAKRDKYNRKSATKLQQQPASKKKGLPIIPEETANAIYYPAYFLHSGSERAWLEKTAYDRAEARFYAAQEEPPAAKTRPLRWVKSKPQDKKKMASPCSTTEKIWLDKYKYDDAERQYYERLSNSASNSPNQTAQEDGASTILRDIARARENIQKSLAGSANAAPADSSELSSRVANLEQENQSLRAVVQDLQLAISKLESRVATLEKTSTSGNTAAPPPAVCKLPAPSPGRTLPAPAAPQEEADDDDDDIDLFGSDEEEESAEAARIREERLRQYAEKKSKKPGLIAKSSILLDVKPWDDETDMAKLEECVRTVQMDGLLWGSSKLVPVGYGIRKLQIQCVVEDDKVGTDMLEEEITKFEDYVQSVDIAAFNKI